MRMQRSSWKQRPPEVGAACSALLLTWFLPLDWLGVSLRERGIPVVLKTSMPIQRQLNAQGTTPLTTLLTIENAQSRSGKEEVGTRFTRCGEYGITLEDRAHNTFQVVRLRDVEQHGVIHRLHPLFDDVQIAAGVQRGAGKHCEKIRLAYME